MLNADSVIDLTYNKDISCENISYSPFFSNIGLITDDKYNGINELCFHYNRKTRPVWLPFISFDCKAEKMGCNPEKLVFSSENKKATLSFYDTDTFVFLAESIRCITVFEKQTDSDFGLWNYTDDDGYYVVRGYSKNGDARDPDRFVPFAACLYLIDGIAHWDKDRLIIKCENNRIRFAFSVEMLDISIERIKQKLSNCPKTQTDAQKISRHWATECLRDMNVSEHSEAENRIFLNAVSGMLYNFKKAPGNLTAYTAYYPNRGGYPCHFLWDTCFQNLALEVLNPALAVENLLLIADCQRHDGKYPQFMCSTWNRPLDTQPALVGWAAKRLYNRLNDEEQKKAFAKKILPSLEKNNEWWLNSRMTEYALVYCDDGLETGQDNSPRFDGRVILAVDMNSYLLNQMKAAAYFSSELKLTEKSEYWNKKAEILDKAIKTYLYDEVDNIFYDALVSSGEKVKIQTASSFIPLWADVSVGKEKACSMINNHLLDKKRFFSDIPFPSVSYKESCYEHDNWWRGPTWPPIAWLMLEILEKYGFTDEYKTAWERLFNMLVKDGSLHELFDSKTGEGLGNADQGWTEAVFIKMFSQKDE